MNLPNLKLFLINCNQIYSNLATKIKVFPSCQFLTILNKNIEKTLERIKGIGTSHTFEGEYIADFIERLDILLEVKGLRMEGNTLKILVGEPKNADQEEILRVITKASLLNNSVAGYEDTPNGKMLYFEFYIPPWNEQYVK
jgi:hypothetical protein